MTDSPLRVLLAGCGKIFGKHVDAIRAAGMMVAGVSGKRADRARAAAEPLGIPWFTDLKEAMSKTGANLVSILTPSGSHAEIGIQAAKMKKHVIVEKPMALRLRDADELISACDKNGVKLFVVKQCRYHPAVRTARRALLEGRFGKIALATARLRWCRRQSYYDAEKWRGTWEWDGGVLANHASHFIDLLLWLAGPVQSVIAKSSTQLAKIEAEDTAVAILRFENGAAGLIEATTAARPGDIEGSVSILGEKGSAVIGGVAANRITHWAFETPQPEDREILKNQDQEISPGGHHDFYKEVHQTLKGRAASAVDGREGKKSLDLIHALYESIESGREVFLGQKHAGCRLCGESKTT